MKITICLLVFTLLMLVQSISYGQLFKKIKDRIKEKSEYVVVEKTSDEVAEKTSSQLDKVFNMDIDGMMSGHSDVNPAVVPDSYSFEWKYSLRVSSRQGDMFMDYYLMPEQPYFGFQVVNNEEMFVVMDNGRKIMVNYMIHEGQGVGMVTALPDEMSSDEASEGSSGFTYETLPEKEILGYSCKGILATNERYAITMYFTADAPVSFHTVYQDQKSTLPEVIKGYFGDEDQVLMMSMHFVDKVKAKQSAEMECIGLEQLDQTVEKSSYNFLGQK